MENQVQKEKEKSLIDELTVSDDFNVGLTGQQIFSDSHISNQKPTQTYKNIQKPTKTSKDLQANAMRKILI